MVVSKLATGFVMLAIGADFKWPFLQRLAVGGVTNS